MSNRYKKGYEFQEHITTLLSLSGYLEGQIYSTGSPIETGHYEKLKRAGKLSYTSPDILIANRWMEDTPTVEFRFGLACSRRDKIFDDYGEKSVTVPTYQRKQLESTATNKKLSLYMIFGRKLDDSYAIGVTGLREPDNVRRYIDASTGNERWNDIYYLRNLRTWRDFIELRISEDDKEPSLDFVDKLIIPWIGNYGY